ncbi:aldo/keto reductase [Acuticoccus sp. M5D2P5]|uniref:aldo/keto reductase n=1 Tax=Acuticoccus kalidii TaxID=2910977 RepID=UPI001F287F85|nr:aldo/keto reductase [Acuticoccus kalidii]
MPMNRLGRSGLRVSSLCLGTMTFGARTEERDAAIIYARAREAGINFIDTADTYNAGKSEEIVGRLIAKERDDVVLATKAANPFGDNPNHAGLSRAWLMTEVERSLKRLDTDRIDVLYLHKEDHETPLEETVRTIEDLVRSGKIRYFGVSNHRSWRIAEIVRYCDQANITRPVVCQPYYHAMNRAIEVEVLPACGHYDIAVFPYSPLARGVLSGKYSGNTVPSDSRASASDTRLLETDFQPASIAAADKIVAHAKARGVAPTAFAIAFVLANPLITGAVVGPRTLEQLEAYLEAVDVAWTADDEAAVDAVVPPGSHAVPHFHDPRYPLEGRPTR